MDPVERALAYVRSRPAGGLIPLHHRVTLNFHPDVMLSGVTVIELFERDGVYRSQFETGTSNGGLTAHPGGDRWAWERRIFGGAYDACRRGPSTAP